MIINRYIIFYFFFALLGWVWESIYCTAQNQKWQNRGFLYGPLCPIYGFGSIFALFAYDLVNEGVLERLSPLQIFIVGFIISMILEYPTSYILEKLFHARWWDYTDVPLNLNGRTSVPTSIGFGLAGILVMNYLIPMAEDLYFLLPEILVIILPFILVGIHSSDLTLTVINLTNFQKELDEIEENFQERMTQRVDNFYEKKKSFNPKLLRSVVSFKMSERRNKIAKKIIEEIEKIEEDRKENQDYKM
ncbi:putative ABC transporter permease [Anaerococcus hydrogenalis]|uniref:putative ABC transporter permease n=1 Tax=Anaerococcus hydrogenalis TaxID=33029 RepID=UPI0029045887|nr:putative ABC transporter permease [Anaerococcus hydrogenalis]MDU1315454.1 putative ABC transporter permease [Anaerococcus hydrogenalis]